jgi:c-di-GMP-related signal transduction protein
LDIDAIEAIIKREASLCYRLLRFLNSAAFGVRTEVRSIHHALVFLGEQQTRRWVQLIATVEAAKGKSSELLFSALVRAHFCEVLSTRLARGTADLFLMGLLSLMDAILEAPMEAVLRGIPLEKETHAVLLGKPSKLRPVYQLMLAYESGEWGEVSRLSAQLGLPEEVISQAYWNAVQWAREVTGTA